MLTSHSDGEPDGTPGAGGNPWLSGIQSVLADSRLAADAAWQAGVDRAVPVRTSSPGLVRQDDVAAVPLEESVDPELARRLAEDGNPLSEAIHRALAPDLGTYGALAAARAVLRAQVVAYKALAVTVEDFTESIAVVEVDTGLPFFDRRFNFPWARLLGGNPQLKVIRVPRERLPEAAVKPSPDQASLRRRMALEDAQSVAYRLTERLASRVGLRGPRGLVSVFGENPLLKEVGFNLVLRGFLLRPLRPVSALASEHGDERITTAIGEVLRPHLASLLVPQAVEPVVAMMSERAADAVSEFRVARPGWADQLEAERPKAVLANAPGTPTAIALHQACRERGIPLVSVQHGLERELNASISTARALFETYSSDLFLAYNDEGVQASTVPASFEPGRASAVGMPAPYYRAGRRRLSGSEPIFYVSMMHYTANEALIQAGVPDHAKADFDIEMIDRVLTRVPHGVLFKHYPSHGPRYLDGDPIVDRARAGGGKLRLFEGRTDLRYLLGRSRVLINSRGMSTTGWCLMSGRPVVYLDIPWLTPLRADTREHFEASVFYFNASSPSFHDEVRELLSSPLEEIDRRWTSMAESRRHLLQQYIHGPGRGAGARGAREVIREIERAEGSVG